MTVEARVILIVAGVIALTMVATAVWLGDRAYRKAQAKKARHEREKAFAKKVIDQHIEYVDTLHAIDQATIMAFEAIIDELVKQQRHANTEGGE